MFKTTLAALALSLAFAGTALAQEGDAFDRLKALAGEWSVVGEDGAPSGKVDVTYAVTASGSAVLETLFPGTEHEMMTVYHRDGDALTLTHYCGLGNQPRMRCEPEAGADALTFTFAGGTNVDEKGMYMGGLVMTFRSADEVHCAWTMFNEGKEAGQKVFTLVRRKDT